MYTLSNQVTCLIRTVQDRHLDVLIRQVALYHVPMLATGQNSVGIVIYLYIPHLVTI